MGLDILLLLAVLLLVVFVCLWPDLTVGINTAHTDLTDPSGCAA
jgi:hypothetical protein